MVWNVKNVEAGFYSIKLVAPANHYGTLWGGGLKLPKILSTWLVHALLEEKKYISKASTFWDYQSTRGAKWASTTQERRIACFFRCYTLLKWFIFFYLGSRGLFKDLNRHQTWLYEVDMFKIMKKNNIYLHFYCFGQKVNGNCHKDSP